MKHRLLSALLMSVAMIAAAQVTPRSAFTTAPTSVLPTLPQSTRLDMIDYYESGSVKAMENQLGGQCAIETLSPDVIAFSTGKSSKSTIIVLPAGKKEIIMLINDVALPAVDSDIRFYNSRWEELDGKSLFRSPELTDWVGKQPAGLMADIENAVQFMTYAARYAPETRELTLTPTVTRLLPADDRKIVSRVLKPSLRYRWNGSKFTPVK